MSKILYKGKPLVVVEEIKKKLIKEIENIKLDDKNFECNGVEEIQEEINIYLDIINGIYQDLIGEYFDRDCEINVSQDLFGEIGYDKIGKESD